MYMFAGCYLAGLKVVKNRWRLHFATDYFTSRWTSRLFGTWLKDMQDSAPIHNFFVVIGLDQLIHHVTLAVTMWYFIFYLGGVQ